MNSQCFDSHSLTLDLTAEHKAVGLQLPQKLLRTDVLRVVSLACKLQELISVLHMELLMRYYHLPSPYDSQTSMAVL